MIFHITCPITRAQFRELEEILVWAADDLATKKVVRPDDGGRYLRNTDAY